MGEKKTGANSPGCCCPGAAFMPSAEAGMSTGTTAEGAAAADTAPPLGTLPCSSMCEGKGVMGSMVSSAASSSSSCGRFDAMAMPVEVPR